MQPKPWWWVVLWWAGALSFVEGAVGTVIVYTKGPASLGWILFHLGMFAFGMLAMGLGEPSISHVADRERRIREKGVQLEGGYIPSDASPCGRGPKIS